MKSYKDKKIKIISAIIDFLGSFFFFWIRKKKIPKNPQKILILKLDRIGDTFLSTPTIEGIRKLFPSAFISAIVAPWNELVLKNNPYIDKLEIFKNAPNVHKDSFLNFFNIRKIFSLRKKIKAVNPEVAIDLEGHPLNVLSMFLAAVPVRIGFQEKIFSFLLTNPVSTQNVIHQSEIYFEIARYLGFSENMPRERIFLNEKTKEFVLDFIKINHLKDFAVMHLGAGRSYRQWPIDKFSNLANFILHQNQNMKIVIIGGKEDKILWDKFIGKVNADYKEKIINAIAALDIPATYFLLSFAKFFIGSESAPMHLAGAQNIPTVAFMNEWSGIERWKPIGEKVFVFRSKNIHNCKGIACKEIPCPNMDAISVEEVSTFLKENILFKI